MSIRVFAARARGSYHILWDKVCQDSVGTYSDDKISIAAVADGHGAAPYFRSHKGSKYAVNCAIKNIKRFLRNADALKQKSALEYAELLNGLGDSELRGTLMRPMFERVIDDWHKSVFRDIARHPFEKSEFFGLPKEYIGIFEGENRQYYKLAYGTTVVAAAICNDFMLAFQLGDGDCISFYGNRPVRLIPAEKETLERFYTYSMCSTDALERVRCFAGTGNNIPSAVFVTTDGVVNSFDDTAQVDRFFAKMLDDIVAADCNINAVNIRKRLFDVSRNGCGDDASVAALISR